MRTFVLLALVTRLAAADELAAIADASPRCAAERAHCLPIQLHIARDDQGLVVSAAWIDAQLATANRLYAAIDVGFELRGVTALPASAVHVETRTDRDAVAAGRLGKHVIDVFVVGRLDDVDNRGAQIRGVAWRVPKQQRKYIILSAIAPDRVLAHELGHVFGLPHSSHAVSIMNKTERARPPVDQRRFADEELAAMRLTLGRLLRDKVIVAVGAR